MRSPYRTRQLARVVIFAALLPISESVLRADVIAMTATFTGGILATGSFKTDGICITCKEGSGLSGFTFSVLDASFNDADAGMGGFTFFSQLNKVSSSPLPDVLTGDHIQFTPTGTGTFSLLWIDSGVPKFSNNGVNVVVPEPSSLILLLTALAVIAKSRVRILSLNGRTGEREMKAHGGG